MSEVKEAEITFGTVVKITGRLIPAHIKDRDGVVVKVENGLTHGYRVALDDGTSFWFERAEFTVIRPAAVTVRAFTQVEGELAALRKAIEELTYQRDMTDAAQLIRDHNIKALTESNQKWDALHGRIADLLSPLSLDTEENVLDTLSRVIAERDSARAEVGRYRDALESIVNTNYGNEPPGGQEAWNMRAKAIQALKDSGHEHG